MNGMSVGRLCDSLIKALSSSYWVNCVLSILNLRYSYSNYKREKSKRVRYTINEVKYPVYFIHSYRLFYYIRVVDSKEVSAFILIVKYLMK